MADKKKKPDLYVVTWLDILGRSDWLTEEDAVNAQPETCLTVGWSIHECPERTILADSVTSDGEWGGLTVIPTSVVVKKKRIPQAQTGSFLPPDLTSRPKKSGAKSATRPKSKD